MYFAVGFLFCILLPSSLLLFMFEKKSQPNSNTRT